MTKPKSAAKRARKPPTPVAETPAGDPELAALVRGDAPPYDAGPVFDAVPVLPFVADDDPPARPRRRRSLVLRFGFAFVVGFLLTVGIGVGALYAWGQQYEGRILPGVSVGGTALGGLTREQAEATIAGAYGSLGTGQITLTGPDGDATTISYA